MIPPSPWLSARMIRIAYLSETIRISAQRITETIPMIVSSEGAPTCFCGLLEGIKRTGADVAVHDPKCGESRAGGQPGSMVFGQCSRWRSLGHSYTLPELVSEDARSTPCIFVLSRTGMGRCGRSLWG